MSKLNGMVRRLDRKKMKVAAIMAKLQAAEPDARKLKVNFAEIFERIMTQKSVEVFEPKPQ